MIPPLLATKTLRSVLGTRSFALRYYPKRTKDVFISSLFNASLQSAALSTEATTQTTAKGREPEFSVQVLQHGLGILIRSFDENVCGEYQSANEHVLHALWLLERTQNKSLIFAGSGQRRFTGSQVIGSTSSQILSADIIPNRKSIDTVDVSGINGPLLKIKYAEGFEDLIDLKTLLKEIRDPYLLPTNFEGKESIPVSQRLPDRKLWRDSRGTKEFDINKVRHDRVEIASSDDALYDFLMDLHLWGAALVENTPYNLEEYEHFLSRFGIVRPTNWGKWFEVFSSKERKREAGASADDAAYSNAELPLHTDGPYNENPLHFQLLQCLKQSPVGGESTLSDGFTAARMLKTTNPDAERLLSSVDVRFRYHDQDYEILSERAILSKRKYQGDEYYDIFYSERLDLTPALSSWEEMDNFYNARKAFHDELYHPLNLTQFKLKEGEMVVFDNRRVLHGRTFYDENTKTSEELKTKEINLTVGNVDLSRVNRYLRGCYLEGVDTRLRALGRKRLQHRSYSSLARPIKNLGTTRAFMSSSGSNTVSFDHLEDCTEEDMKLVTELYRNATTGRKLADRALYLLKLLTSAGKEPLASDTHLGFKVDLYEHGLQTATRCYRAGCSEDLVVAGLLHDIGELMTPTNHGELAAALLRPYVEPKVSWMLENHEIFQMYYYNHMMTPPGDREVRRIFKNSNVKPVYGLDVSHDYYDFTVYFCEEFDQKSFDPSFPSMELREFEGMVRRIFERNPYWHTPNHPKRGAVTGMSIGS